MDDTAPPLGGDFGRAPHDHLAYFPAITLSAADFDQLLANIDTPDPAPALAQAFGRPRRFERTHGYVFVEFTDGPANGSDE